MAWRVTAGVILDADGQPYAWKGQTLDSDNPTALLPRNARHVVEVPDDEELVKEPAPYVAPPAYRAEPETAILTPDDDSDSYHETDDDDDDEEEGIEI